jgi:hypothetical protein
MHLLIWDNWYGLHYGDDGGSSMSGLVRQVGRFSELERAMICDRVMGKRCLRRTPAAAWVCEMFETGRRVAEAMA